MSKKEFLEHAIELKLFAKCKNTNQAPWKTVIEKVRWKSEKSLVFYRKQTHRQNKQSQQQKFASKCPSFVEVVQKTNPNPTWKHNLRWSCDSWETELAKDFPKKSQTAAGIELVNFFLFKIYRKIDSK